jgi:hypothetical protein
LTFIIGYTKRRRGRLKGTFRTATATLVELLELVSRDASIRFIRTEDGVEIDVDMLSLYAAEERRKYRETEPDH